MNLSLWQQHVGALVGGRTGALIELAATLAQTAHQVRQEHAGLEVFADAFRRDIVQVESDWRALRQAIASEPVLPERPAVGTGAGEAAPDALDAWERACKDALDAHRVSVEAAFGVMDAHVTRLKALIVG